MWEGEVFVFLWPTLSGSPTEGENGFGPQQVRLCVKRRTACISLSTSFQETNPVPKPAKETNRDKKLEKAQPESKLSCRKAAAEKFMKTGHREERIKARSLWLPSLLSCCCYRQLSPLTGKQMAEPAEAQTSE